MCIMATFWLLYGDLFDYLQKIIVLKKTVFD